MKIKTKLFAIFTAVIFVVGLAFTFAPTESKAGDEGPCFEIDVTRDIICEGNPLNCACDIIVTPDK